MDSVAFACDRLSVALAPPVSCRKRQQAKTTAVTQRVGLGVGPDLADGRAGKECEGIGHGGMRPPPQSSPTSARLQRAILDYFGHKKARKPWCCWHFRAFAVLVGPANGGYGWTRTTDPSIMSAVL